MSKPRAKKRSAAKQAVSAPELDGETTEASPVPVGEGLLSDIQQQCELLRTWHENATQQLVSREAQLDQFAKTLDTKQKYQSEEAQRLVEAKAQLEADRQQITQLRAELDEEWASLRSLRKAQEKLGQELDSERIRMNRDAFKFSNATSKAA